MELPSFFYLALSGLSFVLLITYILCLIRQSRNKLWNKTLLTGAICTVVLGFVVHCFIFRDVSSEIDNKDSVFSILWMSLISTVELFVGGTKMFDNGVQEVLFGNDLLNKEPNVLYLILLTTAYVAAIITTAYMIGMFFLKHYSSRRWLKKNEPTGDAQIYVLFGININAKRLAQDLRMNHPNALILAIDYLSDAEKELDISLLERIRSFFTNQQEDTIEGATILLKANKNLATADPQDLCGSIGLKDLRPYLDNQSVIYLLYDDQSDNITALNALLESKICCSKIYCHNRHDDLNTEIEEALCFNRQEGEGLNKVLIPEVSFIDSSFLSVRSLLRPIDNDYSALPVNYVKIATDTKGQRLGYVESGFKSMILGFGETGQDALAFLYEYGAFANKDKKKAPFECHVYDNKMDSILGYYNVSHPGINTDVGVFYHNTQIGSEAFWDSFESQITDTNYIIVCVGSDLDNLSIVKQLTKHLCQKDTSCMFCIMVKQNNPDSVMQKTLDYMNSKENHCIKPFGMAEEIWREKVISDDRLTELAKLYHFNYALANNEGNKDTDELVNEWEQRERIIHNVNTPRGVRLNEIRKRSQDYANCLHIPTKTKLIEGPLLQNAEDIVNNIPGIYDGQMYKGDSYTASIIEYLAIGEHLRWEASHIAMGYKRGKKGEETNAERQIHKYIKDYSKLPPRVRHYDWLVIRTTLELYESLTIKKE